MAILAQLKQALKAGIEAEKKAKGQDPASGKKIRRPRP